MKDLFENQIKNTDRPTLELFEGPKSVIEKLKNKLVASTTNEEVKQYAKLFSDFFENYNVKVYDTNGELVSGSVINMYSTQKHKLKGNHCIYLANIISDTRNFDTYFSKSSHILQAAYRKCAIQQYVDVIKLEKEFNEKATNTYTQYYYSTRQTNKDFALFTLINASTHNYIRDYYRDLNSYLTMNEVLLSFIIRYFQHEHIILPLKNLPEKEDYTTIIKFNGELDILRETLILSTCYQQGKYEFGEKKMPATMLKKIRNIISPKEFPINGDEEASLRSSLLIPFFMKFCQHLDFKKRNKPENIIKGLHNNMFFSQPFILSTLLPHIKGFKLHFLHYAYTDSFISYISETLYMNSDYWMSISDFISETKISIDKKTKFKHIFTLEDFENMTLHNTICDKDIYLDDIYSMIDNTFIKGYLMLMASFGLVEIGFGAPDGTEYSCYKRLRYVKITSLGKYVLGYTDEYTSPMIENDKAYFELDSSQLLIRSIGKDNPYEMMLNDIANPIGCHRWRISPATFLQNCEYIDDVKSKIDFFKQYIGKDMPKNWETFISSMNNCEPQIKNLDTFNYTLLQLPSKDRNLLQIISTDDIIRKYVIRAENYIIFIENANFNKVKKQLKKYGYLI